LAQALYSVIKWVMEHAQMHTRMIILIDFKKRSFNYKRKLNLRSAELKNTRKLIMRVRDKLN